MTCSFFLLFCKKKSWKYNNIGMEGLLIVEIGLTSRRIQNCIGRYKHCSLYLLQWHNECFCENIDGKKLYNIIIFYNHFTNRVKSDEKASLLWCDYKPVFIFFSAFSPSTVSAEPPEGASFTEESMTETPCSISELSRMLKNLVRLPATAKDTPMK